MANSVKKFQIIVFTPRPAEDYLHAIGKGNPDSMYPHRFYNMHVFEENQLKPGQDVDEYAREWLSENQPDYQGGFRVQLVSPGPGRRKKKAYNPVNAKGPKQIAAGEVK